MMETTAGTDGNDSMANPATLSNAASHRISVRISDRSQKMARTHGVLCLVTLGFLVSVAWGGKKVTETKPVEGLRNPEDVVGQKEKKEKKFEDRRHYIKTDCLIPEMVDDLKEGMQHFFVQQEEEASKWFEKQCYNETVGILRDNCGCFLWAFRSHSAVNKTELAQLALHNALRMAPYDAQLLSTQGEQLVKQEKFAQAAEVFRDAAKYQRRDKDDSDENLMMHLYNAATAYVQVSNATQAIEMYKEALNTKKGRDKWSLYNSMGLLYYDLEMYDEAISAYQKALDIESDHPSVLRNLAGVYLKLNNTTAALPLLRISAIRDPAAFEAWYYLGGVYMQVERYKDAAAAFHNATKINPNNTDAHKLAAEACAHAEEYGCAVEHFLEAYKILKMHYLFGGCDVLSGLGMVYMEVQQYKHAYSAFLTALQRCECSLSPDPDNCIQDPFSLLDLGVVELALGDATAANLSLSASLDVRADLPEAKLKLMEAKLRLCDWQAVAAEKERLTALSVQQPLGEEEDVMLHGPQWLAAFGLSGGAIRTLTGLFAEQALLRAHLAASEEHLPAEKRTEWVRSHSMGEAVEGSLRVGVLVCAAQLRGADQQALYALLHVPQRAMVRHMMAVYDWCEESRILAELDDDEEEDAQQAPAFLSHLPSHVSKAGSAFSGKTSKEVAQLINRDELHVLLSLDGWNQHHRNSILSFRPAPVQMAALGHRGTMGDSRIAQFFVGGAISTPPELSSFHFTERLVYLPLGHTLPVPGEPHDEGLGFRWGQVDARVAHSTRASLGARLNASLPSPLNNNPIIYSIIAAPEHLSASNFNSWLDIIETSSSKKRETLVVMPKVPPAAEQLVKQHGMVRAHEVPELVGGRKEAALRVLFHQDDNLSSRIHSSDVILDSYTVSNGPMLSLAASLGKPCITLPGDTLSSRAAAEQLLVQGCSKCIVARNTEDYIMGAVQVGGKRPAEEEAKTSKRSSSEFEHMAAEWAFSLLRAAAMSWESTKMNIIISASDTGVKGTEGY